MLRAVGFWCRRSLGSIAVVFGLTLALVVLALLQYRWIGQLSESDRDRMRASLAASVRQFRQEFNRELLSLGGTFRPNFRAIADHNWDVYADRWEEWRETSPYANLLSQVYVWNTSAERKPELLQLNQTTKRFEPAQWPSRFESFKALVGSQVRTRRRFRAPIGRPFTWIVVEEIPLLFQRVSPSPRRRDQIPLAARRPIFYLLLELNQEFIENELLPELAARYFGGPEGFVYQVAILGKSAAGSDGVVYRSSPKLTADSFISADAKVRLLWGPRDYLSQISDGRPDRPAGPPPEGRRPPPETRPEEPRGRRGFPGRRGPIVLSQTEEEGWVLAVKHAEGSLDSAVESLRRRNLAVSFGVLVLLALSMTMIVVSAQRAQRLAKLQMQFVAGVSHELKTPLAVIRSAADNLAEGIVDSPHRIKEYGTLILRQGRRLSTMIEQTLQFASGQANRASYKLRPLSAAEVIDRALEEAAPAIEEARLSVERTVAPELPQVQADENAVKRILQNLVSNALKYGGEEKRVAIRAEVSDGPHGREVHISVEDNGAGIDPQDLPHIFDPFYRGRAATDRQIQGAGLGLSLTREMAQAMGGTVTVKSTPGQGSAFTLHLPVFRPDDGQGPAAKEET